MRTGGYVFPGLIRDGRPLSDQTVTDLLRRISADSSTVHGFRSTFRDWAAERTDYSAEVVEMALAHTIGNQVEAAYRRGDLFAKRHALMSDWEAFCFGPTERGKVIPIRA